MPVPFNDFKCDKYINELFFECACIKKSILQKGLTKAYIPINEGFVYDVVRSVIAQVQNGISPECFDIIIDCSIVSHLATATQSEINALIVFKHIFRSVFYHPRWPYFTTIAEFFCGRDVSDNISGLFREIPF